MFWEFRSGALTLADIYPNSDKMATVSTINIIERSPTVEEYQLLRSTTDWVKVSDDQVALALSNTLFAACAFSKNKLVGMGRVVGDAGLYFYIQDVIVDPSYQGQNVGNKIMAALEQRIKEVSKDPVFIGLMAAKNVKGFYTKNGYQVRTTDAPGMYKYMNL